MIHRCSRIFDLKFVRPAIVGLLLVTITGTSYGPTDAAPRQPLKSRNKLNRSKMRADFERKQREFDRKWKQREKERKARRKQSKLGSTGSGTSSAASRNGFGYRLSSGKSFAYSVVFSWQSGRKKYRIVGKPYYNVRHKSGRNATLMVLGRFRYLVKRENDDGFRHVPSKDYWAGSVKVLDERGVARGGRKGSGTLELPYLMTEFVSIPSLVTPFLPHNADGKEGKRQPAVLTQSAQGPTIWTGFTSSGNTGYHDKWVEAKPLSSSKVRLDIQHGFNRDGKKFSAVYQSSGTFNQSEGLLEKSDGTYRLVENGKSLKVSVVVRRLYGKKLDDARQAAMKDFDEMPKAAQPVEIARKPVSSKLRPNYGRSNLPAKGTAVSYYDDKMSQHYRVIYLGRNTEREVKIRFEGSGETRFVRPSSLGKLN